MRVRILILSLCLLLTSGALGLAADYSVTVSIDAEGLAYLRRTYPGLDAAGLRGKVGEVCGQQIQQAGARDITALAERTVRRYRQATPAEQAAMRDALKALGD